MYCNLQMWRLCPFRRFLSGVIRSPIRHMVSQIIMHTRQQTNFILRTNLFFEFQVRILIGQNKSIHFVGYFCKPLYHTKADMTQTAKGIVCTTKLHYRVRRYLNQRYTYRVLQKIQMKLILICVWVKPAVLGNTKTA